jgi:peptidoglycan hydrolase-like protein with peptidoglycan-binding domain
MVSRVAEVAGSTALFVGVATLVFGLVSEPPYPTRDVRPEISNDAGRVFENDETARLALARFPLPLPGQGESADRTELIGRVQMELARHGLDPGAADGVATPKIRDAIAAYQRQMGLEVTGEASQNLLDHMSLTQPLRQASAPKENGNMQKLVASVQKRLVNLGYRAGKPSGVVTGETRDAIARFERDTGLPVTGEVSVRLVQRLKKLNYAPL